MIYCIYSKINRWYDCDQFEEPAEFDAECKYLKSLYPGAKIVTGKTDEVTFFRIKWSSDF